MHSDMATASALSPYRSGTKFEIRSHTPPQPYGAYYKNKDPIRKPVRGLVDEYGKPKVDHISFVISHPPLDTSTPAEVESHILTIVDKLSHNPKEKGGGPHLVTCYLDADQSRHYVAKIYDGLEYALANGWGDDCMYLADMHYSREAAAYESIPLRFQGNIAPRYFGSWTFPLRTGAYGKQRWVRMILIEHIQGECMLDIILRAKGEARGGTQQKAWNDEPRMVDYRLLPPEKERLDILARIVEAELNIWWYGGVMHGDVGPRNVMISRSKTSNAVSRVALIDFNAAYVLHRCEKGRQIIATLGIGKGLPVSPIERYWYGADFSYRGIYSEWIPESWGVNDADIADTHAMEWLVSRWIDSPNFKRPSDEFLTSPMHQQLGETFAHKIEYLQNYYKKKEASSLRNGPRATAQVEPRRRTARIRALREAKEMSKERG
ncbi:hypothetical protein VTK56DRAFT_6518 [Thermocarpiscus australiensis]